MLMFSRSLRLKSQYTVSFVRYYSSFKSKTGYAAPVNVDDEDSKDLQQIKQLSKYIWPKSDSSTKLRVGTAMGLLLAGKGLNIQVPIIFKETIDTLNVSVNDTNSLMISAGALLVGYGAARLGASLFSEWKNVVFANVAQSAIRKVARDVFRHLQDLDLSWHLSRQTGGVARAIDRGTKGISFLLSSMVFHIFPTALEISLVSGVLSYNYGVKFAVATVSSIIAYTIFTTSITSWRTRFRKDMNAADNQAASKAVDVLMNYETVKYFNNEDYETKQYDVFLGKYEKAALKTASSLAMLNIGQNAVFSVALTTMMLMASHGVVEGTYTVGDLVLINGMIFQLTLPLNFLGTVYRELKQSVVDMKILFALENIKSEIHTAEGAVPFDINNVSTEGPLLSFHNVSFGYDPEKPILKNVSFSVNKAHKVAIVGGSGSGKSTILKLLYRFYDPQSGDITINDISLRQYDLKSWRQNIGVVQQDCSLFNNTIYYNIEYGKPGASELEVYEAAKKAQLAPLIDTLPLKYQTEVGERGLKLSGGEKQRVALARMFLRNAPVMFFDEPTSALDSATESHILEHVMNLSDTKTKTSIIIAHRLSTIMDADEIIVLGGLAQGERAGTVVERGTHAELLNRGGVYADLWQRQKD